MDRARARMRAPSPNIVFILNRRADRRYALQRTERARRLARATTQYH